MARTLQFRGQQLGDGIVTIVPTNLPTVQVVRQQGFLHDAIGLACDSRNMEYGLAIETHLKRVSLEALAEAVSAIQSLQGLQGLLEIDNGSSTVISAENWWLDHVDEPRPLANHGGRFVPSLVVRFVGELEPVYS